MSERWAARFPRGSLRAAIPLRRASDVLAHHDGDTIWLTGRGLSDHIATALRGIPDIIRYTVAPDETITRVGFRIPAGTLPTGPWGPIASLVQFRPQPAALPAQAPSPIGIDLVRSDRAEEPGAILLTIEQWANYTSQAPQRRLRQLRFAACDDGRILVIGRPLPAVHGSQYLDRAGLLVPAGYAWAPALEPNLLRRAMNLAAGDIALLNLDGSYERISAESILPASRSAARLTLDAMQKPAGAP